MHFFRTARSLSLLAGSALGQLLTSIPYPPSGATFTAGRNTTVQVYMSDYIENVDTVAVVIGLASCPGGECYPSTEGMGDVLYQGPYTPEPGQLYANYTVTIPQSVTAGTASLNVLNLYMAGYGYDPVVDYVNQTVNVVA
ncbi:hypothetical protein JVU11DRAFT_8691 [Chiua virens]|nr:hypothetical protein JVU11DRAFT_8691 [Chiua virens]